MNSPDPTLRFSNRVKDYVPFRPTYPDGVIECLLSELGLDPGHLIADVGSGTGILSRLLLRQGLRVIGVEPNREMREAAESLLAADRGFTSVDGRAEATGLDPGSVDWVVAAQAFHWFQPRAARAEFRRILRPPGRCLLIWNDRNHAASSFMQDYESLLKEQGRDYEAGDHHRIGLAELERFFGTDAIVMRRFPNRQVLDLDGLRGRLLSCSYIPAPGETGHERMLEAMRALFEEHEELGRVTLAYTTRMYLAELRADA